MKEKIIWYRALKRTGFIILMAVVATAGIISINDYKNLLVGLPLLFLGFGLYIYTIRKWERYTKEVFNEKN